MPASVTSSMMKRKPQPVSPPMVPLSRVRISDSQTASKKLSGWPPSGAIWPSANAAAATTMTSREITASQPMRAIGPAAIDLSNS